MNDEATSGSAPLSRRQLRALREGTGPAATGGNAMPSFLAEAAPLEPPVAERPLTILTVCTGNICRSPMAEVLLRARLAPLGIRVHSAGTHALVGHAMTDQAQQISVERGASIDDAGAHRARFLVEPMLVETDLVLAMTREHRSHIVQMVPSVLRRTFTVREFARLADSLPDAELRAVADAAGSDSRARLHALAREVAAQRGLVHGIPEDDDVIDPYRRSQATYDLSTAQLVPTLDSVERVARIAID